MEYFPLYNAQICFVPLTQGRNMQRSRRRGKNTRSPTGCLATTERGKGWAEIHRSRYALKNTLTQPELEKCSTLKNKKTNKNHWNERLVSPNFVASIFLRSLRRLEAIQVSRYLSAYFSFIDVSSLFFSQSTKQLS